MSESSKLIGSRLLTGLEPRIGSVDRSEDLLLVRWLADEYIAEFVKLLVLQTGLCCPTQGHPWRTRT